MFAELNKAWSREVVAEFTRRGLVGDEYDRARRIGSAIAGLTHSVLERAWECDPGFASFRRVTLAAMWYASALTDGSMCEPCAAGASSPCPEAMTRESDEHAARNRAATQEIVEDAAQHIVARVRELEAQLATLREAAVELEAAITHPDAFPWHEDEYGEPVLDPNPRIVNALTGIRAAISVTRRPGGRP